MKTINKKYQVWDPEYQFASEALDCSAANETAAAELWAENNLDSAMVGGIEILVQERDSSALPTKVLVTAVVRAEIIPNEADKTLSKLIADAMERSKPLVADAMRLGRECSKPDTETLLIGGKYSE